MVSVHDSRMTFIAMLYALVVGELARKGYENILSPLLSGVQLTDLLHVISHLTLGLILVVASWVGWSKSFKDLDIITVEGNEFRYYLLVVLDILILFFTFSVVMSADHIASVNLDEVEILMYVFGGYFIWGLLAFKRDGYDSKLEDVLPSVVIFVLLWFTFLIVGFTFLNSGECGVNEKEIAVGVDLLLVFYVVLFRYIENKGNGILEFIKV